LPARGVIRLGFRNPAGQEESFGQPLATTAGAGWRAKRPVCCARAPPASGKAPESLAGQPQGAGPAGPVAPLSPLCPCHHPRSMRAERLCRARKRPPEQPWQRGRAAASPPASASSPALAGAFRTDSLVSPRQEIRRRQRSIWAAMHGGQAAIRLGEDQEEQRKARSDRFRCRAVDGQPMPASVARRP